MGSPYSNRVKIWSKLNRDIKKNINWMNLREENEGVNIILKQANKLIKKDKFSSLEYALYYIKQEEESKKKKHKMDVSKLMFFN